MHSACLFVAFIIHFWIEVQLHKMHFLISYKQEIKAPFNVNDLLFMIALQLQFFINTALILRCHFFLISRSWYLLSYILSQRVFFCSSFLITISGLSSNEYWLRGIWWMVQGDGYTICQHMAHCSIDISANE